MRPDPIRARMFALLALAAVAPARAQTWEDPGRIGGAAEAFVRAQLPVQPGRVPHITVQAPNARFPTCAQLQARAFGLANPYGAQTVQVQCLSPHTWSVYVPVQVAWPSKVVVASHALAAGRALTAADLAVVQRDAGVLPPGALADPAEVVGRVLQVGVAAGQDLVQGMLTSPQLVRYGQSVPLVAQGDGVRLVALGIALQDGRAGQAMLARNADSGRVVSGVLDAAGEVVVAGAP